MSGAEFSLACGIIQVLGFALQLAEAYEHVKEGTSIDSTLQLRAKSLAKSSKELEEQTVNQKVKNDELVEVAMTCFETAQRIQETLNDVLKSKGNSFISRAWQAGKILRHKNRIEKLKGELNALEASLTSSSLAHIMYACILMRDYILTNDSQSHNATSLENQDGFTLLNDKLQELIRESKSKSDQILKKLDDLTIDDQTKARDRLLRSLEYDGMNARANEVNQPSTKTFDWVLESDNPQHWSSFTGWLRSKEQIYWISGKPGSGKSTLMKYLIQNESKIIDKLPQLAKPPRLLWYFLWNSGTIQQRNFQGLLAFLLRQVLMEDDAVVKTLLNGRNFKTQSTITSIESKRSLSDWSVDELETALMDCIKSSQYFHIIFLDGLDEIEQSYGAYDISKFALRLCEQENIKVCVSSRPWKNFRDSFESRPRLDLHQLNSSDIRSCVFDMLDAASRKSYDRGAIDSLSEWISIRSEGVFLWAILATRRVRNQLNVLSLDEIYATLNEMPKDIEAMYEQIWKRHEDYGKKAKEEAAFYFHMLIEENAEEFDWIRHDITLFSAAACAMQLDLIASNNATPSNNTHISDLALLQQSREILSRIEEFSAGLIEISYNKTDFGERLNPSKLSSDNKAASIADLDTTISYHLHWTHRAAREFIQETVTGREILLKDKTTYLERHLAYFRSSMLMIHLVDGNHYLFWYRAMAFCSKWVHCIEKDIEQQELLEVIEKAHTSLCGRLPQMIDAKRDSWGIVDFLPLDHSFACFGLENLLQRRYANESIPWPKSYITELIGAALSGRNVRAFRVQFNRTFTWLLGMENQAFQSFHLGFRPTQVVPFLYYIEKLVTKEGPDPGPEFHSQYLRRLDLKDRAQELTVICCMKLEDEFGERSKHGYSIDLLDDISLYGHAGVVLELDLTTYVTHKLEVSQFDEPSKQLFREYVCTPRPRCVRPIIVSRWSKENHGNRDAVVVTEENCPAALSRFCLTLGTDQFQWTSLSSKALRNDIIGILEAEPHIPDYNAYMENKFGFRKSCNTKEVLYRHSLKFHRESQARVTGG